MTIGAYRHKVALDNPTVAPDGHGGYTQTYAPADPPVVDASIEAASVRDLERATAGTVVASATHLVRMRYHAGVSARTRITFRGRTFEVLSVTDVDQRNVALILVCAEILQGDAVSTVSRPIGGPTATAPEWS